MCATPTPGGATARVCINTNVVINIAVVVVVVVTDTVSRRIVVCLSMLNVVSVVEIEKLSARIDARWTGAFNQNEMYKFVAKHKFAIVLT